MRYQIHYAGSLPIKTNHINTDYITAGGASAGANTGKALTVSNIDDFTGEISADQAPTLQTTNVFEQKYGIDFFDSNGLVLYKAHATKDF